MAPTSLGAANSSVMELMLAQNAKANGASLARRAGIDSRTPNLPPARRVVSGPSRSTTFVDNDNISRPSTRHNHLPQRSSTGRGRLEPAFEAVEGAGGLLAIVASGCEFAFETGG